MLVEEHELLDADPAPDGTTIVPRLVYADSVLL